MTKNTQDSDVAFIEALAALLKGNDLTEIEVTRSSGDDNMLNVRVCRQITAAPMQPMQHMVAAAPQVLAAPAAPVSNDPSSLPGVVASPMVGTVYLQAEPGTPAFATVGAQVAEGQTILIIEAMKTMNQIPAPRAGTVKRILVEDGRPVEYGAPLMIIE
jgi:acetyl-CoA carboxylase biotin carboxyl carrier protein